MCLLRPSRPSSSLLFSELFFALLFAFEAKIDTRLVTDTTMARKLNVANPPPLDGADSPQSEAQRMGWNKLEKNEGEKGVELIVFKEYNPLIMIHLHALEMHRYRVVITCIEIREPNNRRLFR